MYGRGYRGDLKGYILEGIGEIYFWLVAIED
jgi:hypothetical protein